MAQKKKLQVKEEDKRRSRRFLLRALFQPVWRSSRRVISHRCQS
jgi:hypothetical protein